MADLLSKARELEAYLEALQDGDAAIKQGQNPPTPEEPIDVNAWKRQFRNVVIAGSSFKAAFFGTLTTEPTVTIETLKALHIDTAGATAIITKRDAIRAAALALIE